MIKVNKITDNQFRVIVEDRKSSSDHIVSITPDYYHKLTNGKVTKSMLIQNAFEFLLEREPKESILSKFSLNDINRYFPEFESEIKKLW